MSFGFDNPFLAAAAFIIIPLSAFILSRLKNPFVALIPLGAPGGIPFKTSQIGGLVKLLKFFELLGVFLLFFSAAGPMLKTAETVWLNRGADIIFILDISPSMAALDMEGKNRFNAARGLISEFSQNRLSDSIGLVAVGEDAALLVPPTADREALMLRLEELRIGELGDGTALGMGLAVAAYHLEKSNARRKIAILITDGENNAGTIHPETAAGVLRDMGVSFWVIAAGSAGEVPIDYIDPYTRIRRTGIYDSRFDPESLRRLSIYGGGTFISAPSAEAFSAAFSLVNETEITVLRSRVIHQRRSLSFQFLISAVILLAIVRFVRRNLRQNLPEELKKKLIFSTVLFFIFIGFSIIALAGPRRIAAFEFSEYRRGLDTVFAIDVSRSMDIRDVQSEANARLVSPSRLERGLSIARESTTVVSGARFAAAIGRSRGYLAVPLVHDNEAVFNYLESLDISSITGRSTNLESLVEAAVNAFQTTSPARKVIVLVSDGEAHSGVLRNALNRCIREGIILTTVAVGSDEGRPVPGMNNPAPISRRNAAVMRMAAERTGGIYIDSNRDDASSLLSAHLLSLAQEASPGNSRSESTQRRTTFIILAIIFYGASKFIPRLSAKQRLKGAPFVYMIAISFILTSCIEGKLLLLEANYLTSRGRYDEAIVSYLKALNFESAAPYAEYGLGLAFHSLDESTAALKHYDNSREILKTLSENEHHELRYRNYYNSGIIFFDEGDFLSAAAAFREALRTDPKRIDAKRNLEISLMSINMEANRETRTEAANEAKEIIFDYLRQQEQQHWRSREWEPEEQHTGPDY